ncbi:MAG: serine hydrolase [Lachnospiraceae bacterium]|nr:serine hydrolase [Lachnospiraceae bacterium]
MNTEDRRIQEIRQRARSRRRKKQRTAAFCLIGGLILLLLAGTGIAAWQFLSRQPEGENISSRESKGQESAAVQTETHEAETQTETDPPVKLGTNAENLYSNHALLIRRKNGERLLDKGSGERIYPASMTKIMTAVVALEKVQDLEEKVRLSEDMFEELYQQEASMAGFLPGEEVSVRNLLYGVMLPSGAECCTGLAEFVAGSEEAFADLMNQKAQELGMGDTHFVNASGLHNEDHYSTAADLAALMEYALQNETFRTIAQTDAYTIEPSDAHPEGLTLYSTLFSSMPDEVRSSGLILGGKTGYTEEAGLCLASFAQIGGEEFILITAGAQGNHETEQFHILDTYEVYKNIGF